MIHSLDINILTNNQGLLNAVNNQLPTKTDSRIWDSEYVLHEGEEDGIKYIRGHIRFHNDNDRLGVVTALRGLSGMIHACEEGSYLKGHNCYHDENKPCNNVVIYEVV